MLLQGYILMEKTSIYADFHQANPVKKLKEFLFSFPKPLSSPTRDTSAKRSLPLHEL